MDPIFETKSISEVPFTFRELQSTVPADESYHELPEPYIVGLAIFPDRTIRITFGFTIGRRGCAREETAERSYPLSDGAWDEIQDVVEVARIRKRIKDRAAAGSPQ